MKKIMKNLLLGLLITTVSVSVSYADTAESSPANAQPKSTPKKKYKKKAIAANPYGTTRFLNSNTFDVIFTGDLSKLPSYLRQFDPSIVILPALGLNKNYDLSVDLQNTDLSTIQDVVSNKTGGRARLVFDSQYNSLRIIYDNKIDVASNTLEQSKIWQSGGTPKPVLGRDGLVMLPFGQYEPKVTCQPLMLCDIQLQAGEIINNVLLGDTANWTDSGDGGDAKLPIAYSGSDVARIPHVILTPRTSGIVTNLVITTTKRTYYMKLYSSNSSHVSRTGFYYPGEIMQTVTDQQKQAEVKNNQILSTDVDPNKLYFKYSISGDKHAPFYPSQVFDDGTRTYIQLEPTMDAKSLPALYAIGEDGDTQELINIAYKAPYFVVPTIFKQAILTRGQDENQVTVNITRGENNSGFFSRLFGSQ